MICRRENCSNIRRVKSGAHTDYTRFCSSVCRDLHVLTTRLERLRSEASGDSASAFLAACVAVREAALWVTRAQQ